MVASDIFASTLLPWVTTDDDDGKKPPLITAIHLLVFDRPFSSVENSSVYKWISADKIPGPGGMTVSCNTGEPGLVHDARACTKW